MFGVWGIFFGILLGFFGIFMVFFFPNVGEHQDENFAVSGIVIGIVSLVIAFFLLFF